MGDTHLLLVILDNLEVLPTLLTRWRELGVSGTTILRSLGGHKASSWLEQVGLAMLGRAFESDEIRQRTLISVIDDDDLLERAIAEAEHIVGGFGEPHTGVLFVLPVTRALGVQKRQAPTPEQLIASAPEPQPMSDLERMRCVPVSEVLAVHHLDPAIVKRNDSLTDVAAAMLAHPTAHVACVVNDEGRLSGLVRLESVVNDLFVRLMPEEFLHDLSHLDEALNYAAALKHRTAADCMADPVSVHPDDTVRTAFERMHDHNLPGIPVIDETHHIVGYVNLLEMLALVARGEPLSCLKDLDR